MSANVKISAALVAAFAVVVAALFFLGRSGPDSSADGGTDGATQLVREDSHRLGEPGAGDVTLVEWLDFECEACLGAYPFVEQLRADYAGRVTFVARYMPMPGHPNAENAAVAVEAAAQQDAFEAMYHRMYDTQEQWSHRQESQAAVFRGFAEDLGLDMVAYDEAVADPATLERVLSDREDGLALGVEGTPTFFLNGQKVEVETTTEFIKLIETALDE